MTTNQGRLRGVAFPSELGWMALVQLENKIQHLCFGHPSRLAVVNAIQTSIPDSEVEWNQPSSDEKRWIGQVQAYAAGRKVDLSKLPVDESTMTSFQTKVRKMCRNIRAGHVKTYGELAAAAGSPGAARAVGSVMSRNPTPLIVPCHRVVGSTGLGGFSAADGLIMKRRLLALEGMKI
jgi:methylated-DNA-[protein]-cysteine S-methyltransferase